jgi:hypothetical protein
LDCFKVDFEKFKEDFLMVGKHLSNSRGKYEDAERRLARFEDKLLSSTAGKEKEMVLETEQDIERLPLQP